MLRIRLSDRGQNHNNEYKVYKVVDDRSYFKNNCNLCIFSIVVHITKNTFAEINVRLLLSEQTSINKMQSQNITYRALIRKYNYRQSTSFVKFIVSTQFIVGQHGQNSFIENVTSFPVIIVSSCGCYIHVTGIS